MMRMLFIQYSCKTINQMIDVPGQVAGRSNDPETFFAAGHGWVIDGLKVQSIFL